MREAMTRKAVESAPVTAQQLELINQHTRRELTEEEVFVFSLILCDNEVDRDYERFPVESLEVLGQLFLGKTGVFDHKPTTENQSARIFDTELVRTEEPNSVGEAYAMLKAWAYMVRSDKNADLILEIDGGIKKEVSVGCAVEQVLCSICGEDQRTAACAHQKGEPYGDALCHHLLVGPTDAYEWSFVAVPAQKNAGVVKRWGKGGTAQGEAVAVSKDRLVRLEQLAAFGRQYEADLRKRVVKLGLLGQPELSAGDLEAIAERLEIPQLEALEKGFRGAAEKRYPISPQLGGGHKQEEDQPDREFQI